MENITTLGIDIAKNVFQLHGIDKAGKVVLQKRLARAHFTPSGSEKRGLQVVMGGVFVGHGLCIFWPCIMHFLY